jgi:branched-chain amino acid transport system substrate-binding protein
VTVYASSAACTGAKRELARQGDRAGALRVEVACLPAVRRKGRLDLAAIGANARRAAEDSTSVAYIGEASASATRFSRTILEEAGIAQLPQVPGDIAMRKVLAAVGSAGGGSRGVREEVRDELE